MSFPDGFVEALTTLGEVFWSYHDQTGSIAVLVGGAATAIHTAGAFMSSDFDIVVGRDDVFEQLLSEAGFLKEEGAGHWLRGFYHPHHPQYSFELVSGRLFDGRADIKRLIKLSVGIKSEVVLPSIEDMIADRLGQHAVASPTDTSRLKQAETLFRLAPDLKTDYLRKRIRDENGDPTLLGLPP